VRFFIASINIITLVHVQCAAPSATIDGHEWI